MIDVLWRNFSPGFWKTVEEGVSLFLAYSKRDVSHRTGSSATADICLINFPHYLIR